MASNYTLQLPCRNGFLSSFDVDSKKDDHNYLTNLLEHFSLFQLHVSMMLDAKADWESSFFYYLDIKRLSKS